MQISFGIYIAGPLDIAAGGSIPSTAILWDDTNLLLWDDNDDILWDA